MGSDGINVNFNGPITTDLNTNTDDQQISNSLKLTHKTENGENFKNIHGNLILILLKPKNICTYRRKYFRKMLEIYLKTC